MEKPSDARNAEMALPVGFRFCPTDQELIVHYLRRKVWSLPLPAFSIIPDHFDVFHSNPWDLPGDRREKRYFFSRNEGDKSRYSWFFTGSGYWKTTGKEKKILATGSQRVIGTKKMLVLHQGKWPHMSRTNWIMYEYRLLGCRTIPHSKQRFLVGNQDWVACCIALKKTKAKKLLSNKRGNMKVIMPICKDSIMEDSTDIVPPQPSPSCSESGITNAEAACDESSDQETNTTCDSCTKKL